MKVFKKTVILVLAIFFVFSLSLCAFTASAASYYDVIQDGAAVHTGAGKSYSVPYHLSRGTIVSVTSGKTLSNGHLWYKLSDGNWIYSPYVQTHRNHVAYSSKITKQATCKSTGTRTYYCKCGAAVRSESTGYGSHSYSSSDYFCVYGCGNYNPSSVRTTTSGTFTLVVTSSDAVTHSGPYGACAKISYPAKKTLLTASATVSNGYGNTWYRLSNGQYIVSTYVKKHSSHTYDSGVTTTAATCQHGGVKAYTCTLCGYVNKVVTNTASHSYDSKTYMCKYGCGNYNPSSLKTTSTSRNTLYVYTTGAKSHTGPYGACKDVANYSAGALLTSVATVKNSYGNTWYRLENGSYIVSDYVKIHNTHTWSSGTVTKKATCTSSGSKLQTCVCGATRTVTISKLSHKYDSKTHLCVNGCKKYDPSGVITTSTTAATYYVKENNVSAKNGPYKACSIVKTYGKGAAVSVVATVTNKEGNYWYKLTDGSFIFKDNVANPSIKLNTSSKSGYNGMSYTLTATVFPAGTAVTWKSDNTSVAAVNSSGKVSMKSTGTCTVKASVTLNGKTYSASCKISAKELTYTVKYKPNCSSYTKGKDYITSQSCKYTKTYTVPSVPYVRTGYTFNGWATSADGKVVYTPGMQFKGITKSDKATVTLYAVWTLNTIKVYYNANGGTVKQQTTVDGKQFYNKLYSGSDNTVVHSQNIAETAKYYQVFKYNTANDFCNASTFGLSRPGYSFSGWNTKADGTGKAYDQTTEYTPTSLKSALKDKNQTLTLYAQWTPYKYTVTYNGNGASAGSMAKTSATYGKPFALRKNTFTLTDKVFVGWSTAADGGAVYGDGATVSNLTTVKNGNVTLYAVWKLTNEKLLLNAKNDEISNVGGNKYWRWYGSYVAHSHNNDSRVGEHCALFASYVTVNYLGLDFQSDSGINWIYTSPQSQLDYFKAYNCFHGKNSGYTPKSGDFVFFNWDGGTSAQHTGLIIVSNGKTYLLHANYNGGHVVFREFSGYEKEYAIGFGDISCLEKIG